VVTAGRYGHAVRAAKRRPAGRPGRHVPMAGLICFV